MAKTKSIIQINGRHYDALSGLPLVSASTIAAPKTAQRIEVKSSPKPRPSHSIKPATGRSTEAAHTLMRQSVKKPAAGLKRRVKAVGGVDSQAEVAVIVSKSVASLDPKRHERAKKAVQSQAISHFSASVFDPQAQPPSPPETPAVDSEPAAAKAPATKSKTTADLLERALENAKSSVPSAAPVAKHRSRRKTGLATGAALAVLLIVAFGGRSLTAVRLHAASAKAGFAASLPGYQPVGYSLGQLTYSSGEVAAQFHSNSSTASYTLTQKSSAWDDSTLLSNYVISRDANYQTVNSGGLTIYLYGQHNATWLKAGRWYILQGNDSLDRQQLIQLAASL
jgi:hypothetical protein